MIDEALDGLARVYVGCLFLRCIAEQQSPWPQASRVSLKSGLVCLEKGKIIGRYLLDEKMKVDLEESISIWLHDCGCRKEWQVEEEEETDEANSFNAMSSGKQGFLSSRNETPGCDICGRNYPHEHVRALQPEGFI